MRRWALIGFSTDQPGADQETYDLGEGEDSDLVALAVVIDRRLGLVRYARVPITARGSLISGLLSAAMAKVARALYEDQARTLAHGAMMDAYDRTHARQGHEATAQVDSGEPPERVRSPEASGLLEGEGGQDRERREDEARPTADGEEGGPNPQASGS